MILIQCSRVYTISKGIQFSELKHNLKTLRGGGALKKFEFSLFELY